MNLTKERAEEWVGFTSWKKLQFHGGKPWKIHATKHVLLIVGSWSACIRAATPPNTFQREQLLLRIPAIQRLQLDSKELIKFLKYSQGQVYNKLYVLVFVPQYQPHVGLYVVFWPIHLDPQTVFTKLNLPWKIYPRPQAHGLGSLLGDISLRAAPFITSATTWGVAAGEKALSAGFSKMKKKYVSLANDDGVYTNIWYITYSI